MAQTAITGLEERIKAHAHELGFDLVGITGAEPSAFAPEYRDWLAQGYVGEMDYLARNLERRLDPRELLPNARSIIVVAMNYYTGSGNETTDAFEPPLNTLNTRKEMQKTTAEYAEYAERNAEENAEGNTEQNPNTSNAPTPNAQRPTPNASPLATFARYALGEDYHDVMTARLKALWAFVQAQVEEKSDEKAEGRVYVDTGPLLEREVARRAGLGWFGKNTMLINTRRGSYFFLGEIVTTVALVPDSPAIGGCGTCTRCLDACPTDAIIAPYKIDARRCLSYLTIELKGPIPEEFRPALAEAGNRIYGCDICQEVCPFNRPPETSRHPTLVPTNEPAFQPREITSQAGLVDLLLLSEEEFRVKFKGSPVKRAKRRGLLRNAAIALSMRDDPEAQNALGHAVNDPEELVREAAIWSQEQIKERRKRVVSEVTDHLV